MMMKTTRQWIGTMGVVLLLAGLGWAQVDAAKGSCGSCQAQAKAKACGEDCTKSCCSGYAAVKDKKCGEDCTKPCCADKKAKKPCCGSDGCAKAMKCGAGCAQKACPVIYPDSPAVLLAKARVLGLCPQQIAKLETILAESRKQALAVLSPEQVAKLQGSCATSCDATEAQACGVSDKKACDVQNNQKPSCSSCSQAKDCSASKAPLQKTCPIMGLPINEKLSMEYEGKTIYFCCPGCVKQFKKDPAKYLEKLPQFQK